MRRAGRTDANQQAIVSALRAAGAVVEVHSSYPVGYDVLVHHCGATVRVEIKDGTRKPSERQLTAAEQAAQAANPATYAVVESVDAALGLIDSIERRYDLLQRCGVME